VINHKINVCKIDYLPKLNVENCINVLPSHMYNIIPEKSVNTSSTPNVESLYENILFTINIYL
jgi:hypothetical protein